MWILQWFTTYKVKFTYFIVACEFFHDLAHSPFLALPWLPPLKHSTVLTLKLWSSSEYAMFFHFLLPSHRLQPLFRKYCLSPDHLSPVLSLASSRPRSNINPSGILSWEINCFFLCKHLVPYAAHNRYVTNIATDTPP